MEMEFYFGYTVTRNCKVEQISNDIKIILTQGLNRQIRRMCEYLGYEVIGFKTNQNHQYFT
jgi:23S rRNA pseudouridine2604 synthase